MTYKELKELNKEGVEGFGVTKHTTINNKTRAFLLPCLNGHPINQIKVFNKIKAVGLWDMDKEIVPNTLTLIMDKNDINLKKLPFFVKNHYYFGELLTGDLHAIVIELPKKFHGIISKFLKGNYSKLYKNPKDIFKSTGVQKRALDICTKDGIYIKKLADILKVPVSFFDTNKELEDSPVMEREIFNFKN